ncbi:BrnT family toxin [Blastochloris tepida]|uniref:Toxin n=1 Tax=Blastochloris tepida TaxID=2233851 RepID=A0A348G444_9HYPH|nr:BrnT family toxin [Blastochloris tepida]BBF94327.1 hypothetical protein BLTE_30120 [Blastochloris tepida]
MLVNITGDSLSLHGFEWDELKRSVNVQKHGIDFTDAIRVFEDDRAISVRTYSGSDSVRWVTVGLVDGRLVAVIHAQRNDRTRIISARAARNEEHKVYGPP